MCYTSGTTGNPKGVVYSHRSTCCTRWARCSPTRSASARRDVVLPVVPMFHANAWGLAQPACWPAPTWCMPGPDLPPGGDRRADRVRAASRIAAGVPDDLAGRARPSSTGRDFSTLRAIVCGGSAVPRSLIGGLPRAARPADPAGLGHDRDQPAGLGRPAALDAAPTARGGARGLPASQGIAVAAGRDPDRRPGDRRASCLGRRGERRAAGRAARGSPPATTTTTARPSRSPTDGWLRTGDVATIDARGLHPARRPHQGPGQVRRRVDLLGRARERDHGPPRGRARPR